MSYYKPSFNQTLAMSRGRGGYSPRGSSYRGSRGSRGSYGSSRGFSNFDPRAKYSSDRYSDSRKFDGYRKPFRDSYSSRERSPDRKKPRMEAYSSSRHDTSYGSSASYGGSRYDSSYTERRSFSGERSMSYPRREEFRRPSGPPRGGYRGRGSSRGSRILRTRERLPPRRRMIESSYGIRKRIISSRSNDFSRRLKISKLRSAIAARRANKSDDDSDDAEKEDKKDSDAEDNEEEEEGETGSPAKKSPKKEKEDSEKHDDKSQNEDGGASSGRQKTPLIKLNCPHCSVRCITFRKYELHLRSRTHMMSMKRVAMKQKAILSQMRQAQRSAQNELEKSSTEDLQGRTNFCPICKLNYKQKKTVHQSSDAHKNMKKFLMPYCKVCSVTFKSPMIYESHCCSIEHLKRKQRMENDASEDSNEEADLENFTTIDSVGDVDEEETAEKPEEPEAKPIVNVGIEKIRKVEAYYCDLCKMYLTRGDETEMTKILAKHCKMVTHMKRYIRYKEDRELEERAQKLQKKETAEKAEKAKKVKKVEEAEQETKKEEDAKDDEDNANKTMEEEENKDDKMWADVDKDLGDILADAEDDDEEDSSAKTKERYDRFKLSEKNGEEALKESKDGEKISNGEAEDVKEES